MIIELIYEFKHLLLVAYFIREFIVNHIKDITKNNSHFRVI